MGPCPVCEAEGANFGALGDTDGTTVVCPVCGEFSTTSEAIDSLRTESRKLPALRAHVSGYLREMTERRFAGEKSDIPLLATSRRNVPKGTGIDDLLSTFPRSVQDRLDTLLTNLVRRSEHPGAGIILDCNKDYPLGYAENTQAAVFLLRQLRDDGFITLPLQFTAMATQNWRDVHLEVTPKGWNRFAELQRGKSASKPLQAFIAMWMDPSRRGEWEPSLRLGIERAGYKPQVIDQINYIGSISDRIISEIRRSRLVVADFTGQRQNVYFEAGFAEGLGIPVFYTCIKSEIGQLHFDKRQENVIDWSSPEELSDRLHRRIEAVLARPPEKRFATLAQD